MMNLILSLIIPKSMSTDANFLLLNNVLLKTLELENYALYFQQVKEKVKPSLDQIVNSLKVNKKYVISLLLNT